MLYVSVCVQMALNILLTLLMLTQFAILAAAENTPAHQREGN